MKKRNHATKISRRDFNRLALSCPVLSVFFLRSGLVKAADKKSKRLKMPLLKVAAQKKFGQDWIEYPTRTINHLGDYTPKKDRRLGLYLGLPSNKTTKTGFWHVERHDGRFWLVDPEGNLNIHRAVCSINPGGGEQQKKAFKEKFKTMSQWADETNTLLWENGFNGTGSWGNSKLQTESQRQKTTPLAFTVNLSLMSRYGKNRSVQVSGHRAYPNDAIFAFEPEFEAFCDRDVAQQVAKTKDDPSVLGYFTDNELPFKMNALEGFLKLENPNDPGRKAAEKWLAERNKTKEKIVDADRWAFLGFLGDRYSSITAAAIRKHAPNQLILGPRLYSDNRIRQQLMKSIAKYIDIISFNYYGVWTPLEEQTKGWTEWTDKPFMVTEWYTKGMDSGLPNKTGAGWNVKTQNDRGLFYENYTLALLECRNCVGWHWFKYQDNDPTAKNVDPSNIDSNKGIVDNHYEPYTDLMKHMKPINEQVFDLIEYFDS